MSFYLNEIFKRTFFDIFDTRVCCNIQGEKVDLICLAFFFFECLFNFPVPSMKFCIVYLVSFWKHSFLQVC